MVVALVAAWPATADAQPGAYHGDSAYDREAYHEKWIPRVKQQIHSLRLWNQYSLAEKHERILHKMRVNLRDARRIIRAYEIAQARAAEALTASSGSSSISPTYYGGELPPASVIECESKGSYTAENPSSGAYGRYQLMPEHFAPGGACDDLDLSPAGQDECAARLWDGGAGASNWQQCL